MINLSNKIHYNILVPRSCTISYIIYPLEQHAYTRRARFASNPEKKEGTQASHHRLDRSAKGPRRTGRPRTLLDEPVAPGQLTTESANEKKRKEERRTREREEGEA